MDVKKEALRYLGYGNNEPDEATEKLLIRALDELKGCNSARYCYKVLEKSACSDILKGKDIVGHLEGCERLILFAATLGTEADRLIRRAEISDMAYAVVLDAAASAFTEEYCDKTEKEINRLTGGYFTFRFGLGYGDFPISLQKDFIRILNADKLIGLTANENGILIPRKSVTAVIGISDKPLNSERERCEICSMKETCKFRKEDKRCDS